MTLFDFVQENGSRISNWERSSCNAIFSFCLVSSAVHSRWDFVAVQLRFEIVLLLLLLPMPQKSRFIYTKRIAFNWNFIRR